MPTFLSGTSIKVWINSNLELDLTSSTGPTSGGLAFVGTQAGFDSVEVGYDVDHDYGIDNHVAKEAFASTSVSPTHDNNGKLTFDGTLSYDYDAWNRMVTVKSRQAALTLAAYSYDTLGRRIKKVVTKLPTAGILLL